MRLLAAALLIVAGCSNAKSATPPPEPRPVSGPTAFEGAVGHGAGSKGGRGGRIMIVDSLADDGSGSLRACVEASGPRVCVFRIAGVVRFTTRPPIIRNPFLTIAGQTAPGDGITLTHGGGVLGRTPLLIKDTHDIVVRDIRVRNDREGTHRGSEDSITIENSDNVIIDHVSASWARDELINGYGDNDRITISHSIFAQGIPRHDKCALLASDPRGSQRLSFIGNLCAHNGDRNPDLNFPPESCVEIANNVFYNAESEFAEVWESFGGAPVALIGNAFLAGPNTPPHAIGIARNLTGSTGSAKIYAWDNVFDGQFVHVSPVVAAATVAQSPCAGTVVAQPGAGTVDRVLADAGSWPRDPFDREIVEQVRHRSGRIVHEPGVIPAIAPGTPYPDADRDGMDDRWEQAHGADPARSDPWAAGDGKGAANLDRFLDHLARRRAGAASLE